jgi:hypothetical protein
MFEKNRTRASGMEAKLPEDEEDIEEDDSNQFITQERQ